MGDKRGCIYEVGGTRGGGGVYFGNVGDTRGVGRKWEVRGGVVRWWEV